MSSIIENLYPNLSFGIDDYTDYIIDNFGGYLKYSGPYKDEEERIKTQKLIRHVVSEVIDILNINLNGDVDFLEYMEGKLRDIIDDQL